MDSETEGISDIRGRDMVPCTIIAVGKEGGGSWGDVSTQIENLEEESFTGAEDIVAALGVSNELATPTIILCDEFQCVEFGGLNSWCG